MNQSKWIGAILALLMLAVLVTPALAIEARGRITSIDNDKHEFTMTTSDNKTLTFRFKEDVKVKLNDSTKKLSDLKVGYDVVVDYTREGDNLRVSSITARSGNEVEAAGKIKSMDAGRREFTMTTDDDKTLSFRFDDNIKIQLNDKNSKLNDLRVGDRVRVRYTRDQDNLFVREINAQRKD